MVYSTKQMYDIALAIALDNGPRTIRIGGKETAAYCLSKNELKRIFVEHGYNPRRHAWVNSILDWTWLCNVLVPKEIKDDTVQNCWIAFSYVGDTKLLYLKTYAEDNNVSYFPRSIESPGVSA